MSEARFELANTLSKIHALISSIPTAEQKAASVSEYYQSLKVGFDRYGNQQVPNNLVEAAKRANDVIKSEVAAAVEKEFQEQVQAVAVKIETLRAVLPQLAAKAAVELGQTAREIAALRLPAPSSTTGEAA